MLPVLIRFNLLPFSYQFKILDVLSLQLIGAKENKSSLIEIGPIILDFEISGYVCSNLQIQFLRVFDRELSYAPMKWVRYITTSDSYIVKLK